MLVPGAGSDGGLLDTLWDTAEGSSWDGGAYGEVFKDKNTRQAEEVKKNSMKLQCKVGEEGGREDIHPTACGGSHAGTDGYVLKEPQLIEMIPLWSRGKA